MALSWIDVLNGDILLDIRNKINSFNNSVIIETDTISNSVTNNSSDILSLQELSSYNYNIVKDSSTTSSVYSQLNSLTVASAPAGTYEYKFSMVFSYDSTTRSAFFRCSVDGGTTWLEMRREAKDITDMHPVYYGFPYEHTGGDINLIVEYRTETDGDILNVPEASIMAERKV